MPRDGSGIYVKPFPDVVDGTTIESTVHNGEISDIEYDLNAPRPIVAGGTGASSADQALQNLHGEKAKQVVDNYNSFPFVNGSFYSNGGTTGEPVANHGMVGTYYEHANSNYATIEARDVEEGVSPGHKWVRQKTAGVWDLAWTKQISTTADLDAAYCNVAGDTMTGALTLAADPAAPLQAATKQYVDNNSLTQAASDARYLNVTGDMATGSLIVASANGSSMAVTAQDTRGGGATITMAPNLTGLGGPGIYTEGAFPLHLGVNISPKMTIGTNGDVSMTNHLKVSGNVYSGAGTATVGTYVFGSDGSKRLAFDGSTYSLFGGPLALLPVGSASAANAALRAAFAGGGTQYGICLRPVADNTAALLFANAADVSVGQIAITASATSYVTSSARELKEDLKSFDAGNIVDSTNVYDFKWRSTGERAYGVVAQEANEVYPTAVVNSKIKKTITAEGKADEEVVEDFWGVDYSKYVPVLLQELKALRERVRDLEDKVGVGVQPA